MKSIIICAAVGLVLPSYLFAQGGLVNNGAALKVGAGTSIRVNNGSITNKNNGAINNNGDIHIDGNFAQTAPAAYNGTAASWLVFGGNSNQTTNATAIARLQVSNSNALQLLSTLSVSTEIDLSNNSDIQLGNFNLQAGNALISNFGTSSYIITDGTGVLERTLNNGDNKMFPVGNSTYNPVTLSNSGTNDNFQVKVTDNLLSAGATGTAVTNDGVNRTWHISESVAGGSVSDITVEWEQGQELSGFDRSQSGIAHWTGSAWSAGVFAAATNVGGTRWSRTRTGQTSFSPFAVEDVSQPLSGGVVTPLTATVTKTNNICNGECAGTATVTAAGGTMPYTYLWSNGQTTSTATGLCYGAYNVVVTDALGTTVQKSSIFILQPSAISVAATIAHKTCSVQGSISAVASGGTGAKTFLWSTGSSAGSITGLVGATYGLTVTDAAGCQKAFSYFVDDLCYVISISKNDINTCTATCTGDATVTATEGVAPYTYLWSNGQTTATATGLCKQNYRVTVTDANNIVRIGTVSIAFSQLSATYTATQATCNGTCNGTATVLPTGAQAPYTFVWNSNAANQTTQTATGLCAGAYNVTITSANGCTMVKKFINVGQPPAISLATSSTPSSCANDGTAIVSVTNGVAPLTYAWSNGGSTADIASLAPGTYTVTVTDANGCMKTKSVTVGNACGAKPTENTDLLAEENILDESMPTAENTDINETLRLNDFALVDAFNVYPNPNNGLFSIDIQLVAETDARLRIHDVLGRTLLEQNLQGQIFQVTVDAKTWTSGAYFVQLISADGQTTRKVLISNE